MPKAAPADFGFSRKSPPTKNAPSKRRALPLLATYLFLATLCGCSVLSSAALSSKDYVVGRASAVTDTLQSETLHYLGDSELEYYKEVATQIDYTHVGQERDNRAVMTEPPRRIRHPREDEIVDITLAECIQRALSHSDIIRDRGQFLSPANTILNSSQQASSIYDPAIQETGILLGNRGVEAALADFDTNWTVNALWGRDEQIQNTPFGGQGLPPGRTFVQETATFTSQLQKQMATGASLTLSHNVNYQGINSPPSQRLFPSVYTGNVQAQYRHPLLAGSGVEFNRIAGPTNSNPLRISGVNQGVVIARINEDISIADFEAAVRNLLKDVEDLYWELALAYRAYDAEIIARNSNLEVWRFTKNNVESAGRLTAADLAQSEEAFFDSRSRAEEALARIYATEAELRRLMGLPVNDGCILRPVDEPTTAEFLPDWHMSLAEAMTNRVELRRQKWLIKSLELQLKAAHSLVRPRLDFVSQYQVNMFGDHLLSYSDQDEAQSPTQGLNSAYETLTQGNQTGWNLGFEFVMPFGFRTANSQVRNLELQVAKARKLLAEQELEVSHELGRAFQELDRAYQTAQTNFNRRRAAQLRVQAAQVKVDVGLDSGQGGSSVDLLLRAQISLAQAEVAYYNSLIAYNQAIAAVHYRKGTLLEFNNVTLAEGPWDPQAYVLALRRAWARSHALDVEHLMDSEPEPFVTGQEELNLLMPQDPNLPHMHPEAGMFEQGAMNLIPEMPLGPAPEPVQSPTNPEPQEPAIPAPVPGTLTIESTDTKGWRKSNGDQQTETPVLEMESLPPTNNRRPELPLR